MRRLRTFPGSPLLAAVELIEPGREAKKILRVTFPLGMLIKYGTRLIVYGVDPQQAAYVTCTAVGCLSDYEARVGKEMAVQAIDKSGKPFTVTLSLADFWVAFDGPRTESIIDETEQPLRPWRDDALTPEVLRQGSMMVP